MGKARSTGFFDAHPVHVQANTICKLADKVSDTKSPDYFALINQAISDVDHTLLLLQGTVTQSSHSAADIRMLEDIRDQVWVKVADPEELEKEADRLWATFQSQEGFVLAARKRYASAGGKGSKLERAHSYCLRAIMTVSDAHLMPAPALYATAVQIYYQWLVRRQMLSGQRLIAWQALREHAENVVNSPQYADDLLFRYIYALTLAHLGIWASANALFAKSRSASVPNHILWAPRDFLLNEDGGIRRVQGVMRSGPNRMTLYVEDLKTDFFVERGGRWPKQGEIAHAAIQFSFGGANAVDQV